MAVAVHSPGELLEASRSPYAVDDLVEQGPLLAVEVDPAGEVGSTLTRLGPLPLVVVGVADSPPEDLSAVECFDLLLSEGPGRSARDGKRENWVWEPAGTDQALDGLVRRLDANPQASVTLVQLLRLSERSSVASGLVAESLAYATLQAGAEHRRWLAEGGSRSSAAPATPAPAVGIERDGDLLELRFCRPEVHNAFGTAARDALVEALQLAAADDTIGRVHLSGEGSSFCSGGDLREFGSGTDPATAHLVRTTRSAGWWMHRLADKLTVELHGACIGAGIELAAFADQVVVHADTRIRLPEIGMGLVPGAGGTVSLPRRIGRQRTAWLCLSGATLDAEQALMWGLADRPADQSP
jgi:enoyl-CoA hydratase/carnithine racemase